MKNIFKILALAGSLSPLVLVILGRPLNVQVLGIVLLSSIAAFIIYLFHILSNLRLNRSEKILWSVISIANVGGVVYWFVYILPELRLKNAT